MSTINNRHSTRDNQTTQTGCDPDIIKESRGINIMKNELVKKDDYSNLDKKTLTALKSAYKSLENNMLKVAGLIYTLKEQDEEQLLNYCKKELNVSTGTLSKFYTVGKIVALEGEHMTLPKTYTGIYALHPVSAELESFNEYVSANGKTLDTMSVRDIEKTVKQYNNDGTEEAEVEEVEETEAEAEEAEETEVIDLTDYFKCIDSFLTEHNAPLEVLEAFNNIISYYVRG